MPSDMIVKYQKASDHLLITKGPGPMLVGAFEMNDFDSLN